MIAAMQAGQIGYIDTPRQGQYRPENVAWCADNGCFSDSWREESWWRFLVARSTDAATCAFAVVPDVVADAAATLARFDQYAERVRDLGYPVALVAQDGQESLPVPWDRIDALFIGGSTEWKLGPHARQLATEAKRRGKWLHMGRVNSERRYEYARAIGCDSVDGTFLTFGPDKNLPRLLAWTRNNDQADLFGGVA